MRIWTPTIYIEKESKLDFIPGDNPPRGVPCDQWGVEMTPSGSPTRGYLEGRPMLLQGPNQDFPILFA